MFRVIASDLDGTLLASDSKVNPFTASTLREVQALGLELVIATARHYLDASHFQDHLGIRAYFITLNGARAHDPDGAQILSHDLEPAVARALMRPEIMEHRLLNVLVDDAWLVNRPCAELEVYSLFSGFAPQVRDLACHDGQGVAKMEYIGEEEDLARLATEILERFGERVCVTSYPRGFLEVMAPAASKGRALIEVLRQLDVPASACVAFGDGQNDIDMLAMVGQPFVMSGSSPKLLAALPEVPSAGSNDQAGVASTLRKLFGLPG